MPLYCWFDTEYSTNDYERAELLEVALLLTDESLAPVVPPRAGIPPELLTEEGFTARLKPPPRERISRFVLENQPELLARCEREGIALEEVDGYLARYLDGVGPLPEDPKARPILSGNTIHADYFLARKFLPELTRRLSFRVMDVTALKLEWLNHYRGAYFDKRNPELVARYYPGRAFVAGEKHSAFYDVQASVAELAYYRSQLGLRTRSPATPT